MMKQIKLSNPLNEAIHNKTVSSRLKITNKGALDGQFSIDHTMTWCSKKLNLN